MGVLKTLQIDNFRNLRSISLELNPHLNLVYGANGSGKSSLLEAIYTLAYGKSYRNHLKARVITHGQDFFRLFSHFTVGEQGVDYRAGVEKSQQGETLIRLNGESLTNFAELAKLLPVQLINPNSYEILEDGPAARRKYLDWGVFHVEHEFHEAWRNYSRCLKQRNLSLKLRHSRSLCQAWDHELVSNGEIITQLRTKQLILIEPLFQKMLQALRLPLETKLSFYQGWASDTPLVESIANSFDSDYQQGFTHSGPHRADVKITVDGIPGDDVLSRGQEKLVVTALQLAQAQIVSEQLGCKVIYLIDDLASELDPDKRNALFDLVAQIEGQLFITATEADLFPVTLKQPAKMFHVEQGGVK